jgi:hypothetical protein
MTTTVKTPGAAVKPDESVPRNVPPPDSLSSTCSRAFILGWMQQRGLAILAWTGARGPGLTKRARATLVVVVRTSKHTMTVLPSFYQRLAKSFAAQADHPCQAHSPLPIPLGPFGLGLPSTWRRVRNRHGWAHKNHLHQIKTNP